MFLGLCIQQASPPMGVSLLCLGPVASSFCPLHLSVASSSLRSLLWLVGISLRSPRVAVPQLAVLSPPWWAWLLSSCPQGTHWVPPTWTWVGQATFVKVSQPPGLSCALICLLSFPCGVFRALFAQFQDKSSKIFKEIYVYNVYV